MQHPVHVTTRCYGLPSHCNIWPTYDSQYELATRLTPPLLTQRTVKTGISIYQPRRPSNAASSPRNDSLLRTALALQQLAYVRLAVRASNQIDPSRLTQRTVKTGTSIYQIRPTTIAQLHSTTRPTSASCYDRPAAFNDSTDLCCPQRSSSCIQWLGRPQLPVTIVQLHSTTRPISAYPDQTSSCISTTRPTPATLVERPAAHIYNSTIPAIDITHLAEDYIQPPRILQTCL